MSVGATLCWHSAVPQIVISSLTEYKTTSEATMEGMDPRLTKLLELSASVVGESSTPNEDGELLKDYVPSEDFAAMSMEEKKAMIDHIIGKENSDAEQMIRYCDAFVKEDATVDEKEDALDRMLFLVDSIDNSMDIGKTGVMGKLLEALGRSDADVRTGAAWVLGVALKDNPSLCVEWITAKGVDKIMDALRDEPVTNDEAKSKYMTVLSSTLELSPAVQKAFVKANGYALLTASVAQASTARSTAKALFVCAKLITAKALGVLASVTEAAVVDGVVALIATRPDDDHIGAQRVEMALRLIRAVRDVGVGGTAYAAGSTGKVQAAVVACANWVATANDEEQWGEIARLAKGLLVEA